MDTKHNCVIIAARPTDYIAGVNSPLPFVSNIPSGDWTSYLPDFDLQKEQGFETDACVTFSAVQSTEMQINWLLKTNQLPQYHIDQLKSLGFLTDGTFHASERYIAVLDNTTTNGNTMPAPWDAIRKYGLIPYEDMPFSYTITDWAEYYTQPTPDQIAKGQKLLELFAFNYEYIWQNPTTSCPIDLIIKHLQQAPLCISTPVCWPWNQLEPPVCSDTTAEHSTLVYSQDQLTHILDHYVPFLKEFPAGYFIPYVVKGIVSIVPPPSVSITTDSLPANIAPTQKNLQILQLLVSLWQKLILLLTGQ